MTKLQIKSETMATIGGIFHVMDAFERLEFGKLIDSRLGMGASWTVASASMYMCECL